MTGLQRFAGRLVLADLDTGRRDLVRHEPHRTRLAVVGEEPLAAAEPHRLDHQVELVDEVRLGPFAETKDLIAGWMVIDVDSHERAVELAAELSLAPGAGGNPIHEWLELRPFFSAPPTVTE